MARILVDHDAAISRYHRINKRRALSPVESERLLWHFARSKTIKRERKMRERRKATIKKIQKYHNSKRTKEDRQLEVLRRAIQEGRFHTIRETTLERYSPSVLMRIPELFRKAKIPLAESVRSR